MGHKTKHHSHSHDNKSCKCKSKCKSKCKPHKPKCKSKYKPCKPKCEQKYINCEQSYCCITNVVVLSVDLNQTSTQTKPMAKFMISDNPSSKCKPILVCAKYKAIVSNSIIPIKKCYHLELSNGMFEFCIPRYTTSLEFTFKVFYQNDACNTTCSKVRLYYPEPCESMFRVSNLSTRLVSMQCSVDANAASALDHTPVQPGEVRTAKHQAGPLRTSRAMAIVHIAMFEALNAIVGNYTSYIGLSKSPNASADAAICQAARNTLVWLYPSQQPIFDSQLAASLSQIPNGPSKILGVQKGAEAAQLIIAMRTMDGSQIPEPAMVQGSNPAPSIDVPNNRYLAGTAPGFWRNDPITPNPVALGARWSEVTPFSIPSASAFRCGPPPALSSVEYAMAFNEVKSVGGDGVITPTIRSQEMTDIGTFWAYDGSPVIGVPIRLYNQIAMQICNDQGLSNLEFCRALALINIAMADAGIAGWEAKYFYNLWRPVTAIRESDIGTGPSNLGDSNAGTVGDATWTPYGAPLSNKIGVQGNPNFPAYVSGHAIFSCVMFVMLEHVLGRDDISFTFVSDELNGITTDNQGNVRPLKPRTFTSLSQADEENGQSRMYLGIHFNMDKVNGISMGKQVADHVFANVYN